MDGAVKPPDTMDITMTRPAPDMVQIGLSGVHASPSAKRLRTSSVADSTNDFASSADILNAADENVLPTVDSNAMCLGCNMQIKDIAANIITCSSCSRKFHANCSSLESLNKRVKVMPSPTNIMRYNEICKNNVKYLGGAFPGVVPAVKC